MGWVPYLSWCITPRQHQLSYGARSLPSLILTIYSPLHVNACIARPPCGNASCRSVSCCLMNLPKLQGRAVAIPFAPANGTHQLSIKFRHHPGAPVTASRQEGRARSPPNCARQQPAAPAHTSRTPAYRVAIGDLQVMGAQPPLD